MAIETQENIVKQLMRAAERMKAIRIAADKLRLLRTGPEPDPRTLAPLAAQPAPRFLGQPERSD